MAVDLSLAPEQEEMRKVAHEFAEKEIRPVAPEYDEKEEYPWPVVEKAHRIGLTNYYFPEEYGGGGITDAITEFVVGEELHWGCAGIATAIHATALAAAGIFALGTEEQKKKWIPLFCDPENLRIGAMGLTEPHAGSDAGAIRTTARREGDYYVLNGQKMFCTNGGIADLHLFFATEDPSLGWAGIAGFIVPKDTPGLVMLRKERKMGVRASHTATMALDEVRVPAENRLGPEPTPENRYAGAVGALKMLERTRPGVGAGAVGIARAAFEYALDYARERYAFGKPIALHQAIAFKFADMATQIDAARLLVWRAGWMMDRGLPLARGEGSMAKLYAGDVAVRVCVDAIQILGGHGYIRDHPVEKWLRDAKVYQIWEGTAEIQRLVISRAITGKIERKEG